MAGKQGKIRKKYQPYEMVTVIERLQAFSASNKASDYGTGELYYTREIHMLSYIADHEGISPSAVATNWNQTRGAISQMLRKLIDRGLIRAEQDKADRRSTCLYVTEKGKILDQKHKKYDTVAIEEYLKRLRTEYTEEEIQLAYSILDRWVELFLEPDRSAAIE